jgi:hypothetical protein
LSTFSQLSIERSPAILDIGLGYYVCPLITTYYTTDPQHSEGSLFASRSAREMETEYIADLLKRLDSLRHWSGSWELHSGWNSIYAIEKNDINYEKDDHEK